jgi:sulfopyruvate decarboxylase subunit beta
MLRFDVLKVVVEEGDYRLIVCNIGDPSRELHSIRDSPNQFYMLGSMGMASSIGLGLAIARPDRQVLAIDGDGAVLMNLGTLATMADQCPPNYALVIVDNGVYGSTGGQPTCTSRKADLGSMARGAGAGEVRTIRDQEELRDALRSVRSGVLVVKVSPGSVDGPIIELTPRQIIDRFMAECQRPSL